MESGFSSSNPRRLPIAYMIVRTAKSISPFTNVVALHRAIRGKLGRLGAAWVTEGEQNAIARVDPVTRVLRLLPKSGATPT